MGDDKVILEVYTFNIREMMKKVRKPRVKPTRVERNPFAYNRKSKHRRGYINEV